MIRRPAKDAGRECQRCLGRVEEIHCSNGLAMVSEERQLSLHGTGSLGARQIHRETLLFERSKPSLQRFAVNTQGLLSNHRKDQGAHLFADTLPSTYSFDLDLCPIQTEAGVMPVHDGSRSDQDKRLPPPGPPTYVYLSAGCQVAYFQSPTICPQRAEFLAVWIDRGADPSTHRDPGRSRIFPSMVSRSLSQAFRAKCRGHAAAAEKLR